MNLIAQVSEGVDLAKQALKAAEPFGFNAIMVMVMFATIVFGLTIHFLKVVIPEKEARIKQSERLTTCHEQNTQYLGTIAAAVQTMPCRGSSPHQPIAPPSRSNFGV